MFSDFYCESLIKCLFFKLKIKREINQNNQILEKLVHLSMLCLGQLKGFMLGVSCLNGSKSLVNSVAFGAICLILICHLYSL